ncbi:hypothetical protein quinque_013882 [Culex quinquefasciatus]
MQKEIQNVVEDKEPGDKTDWKKSKNCLVFPTMVSKRPDKNGHIACEYYRAQVIDDLDDSTFTVFLIDLTLRQNHPAAIRRFLAQTRLRGQQGLIYLEQEPVVNALRKVINAKFADSSATDKFYSDNEPCIAKFHQDNKFYRAIVRKAISCRRYKVQFIDYGNIEEVDIADLRKNVNCGRVPIQMNSYRLTNVAPNKATPGRRKSSTRCIH